MKTIFLLLTLSTISIFAFGGNRYWVASSSGNWNDTNNWAYVSGGSSGASVPSSTDKVYFNEEGTGDCTIDANVSVNAFDIASGYTGNISQGSYSITVTGFSMAGGTFTGGSADMTNNSNFTFSGGIFTSTSVTLYLNGAFYTHSDGTFNHNNGTVEFSRYESLSVDLPSSTPDFYNVNINLGNSTKNLSLSSGDILNVLNKLSLMSGKIPSQEVRVEGDCQVDSNWGEGSAHLVFTGSNDTQFIYNSGVWNSHNITIEKDISTAKVTLVDLDGDNNIVIGNSGYSLTVEEGVFEFSSSLNVDMNYNNLYIKAGGTFVASDNQISWMSNYNNNGGIFTHNNGKIVFEGSAGRNYVCDNVPADEFYDVQVSLDDGLNLTFSAGDTMTVLNNLELTEGAVNSYGSAAMKVQGNVDIADGFDGGGTALVFIGTNNQTLDLNSTPSSFNADIILDKDIASDVTLLSDFRMDANYQNLVLTKGYLVTSSSSQLIIDDLHNYYINIWSGGSDSSFVEGPIQKIGDAAFRFPVGSNQKYAPIDITAPSNASDAFTAEYFGDNPDTFYDTESTVASIKSISSSEYWELERTSGTSEVAVTLSWEMSRSGEIDDISTFTVASWDGTEWQDLGNSSTTGDTSEGTVLSLSDVTSYIALTLASTSENFDPLPVELSLFRAQYSEGKVYCNWQTLSELENNYFVLQKSKEGKSWTDIKTIQGAGNSNTPLSYQYTDSSLWQGKAYYRLKQVDFDGTYTYSDIQYIYADVNSTHTVVDYFPNPTTETVQLTAYESELAYIKVYNLAGIEVNDLIEVIMVNETNVSLDLRHLEKGVYFIKTVSSVLKIRKL